MKGFLDKAKRWISERRSGVVWSVGAVVVAAALYLLTLLPNGEGCWLTSDRAWLVLGIVGAAAVLHFIHCFTRDLPAPKDKRLSPQLRSIFVYGYVFLAFALGASLSPLVVPKDLFTASETWAGVVDGCLRTEDGYGSELTRCDDNGADQQWLLQIGSRSVRSEVPDEDVIARIARKAVAACATPETWTDVRREFDSMGSVDETALIEALKGMCPGAGAGIAADVTSVLRERGVAVRVHSELSRGLVVPLYVVVLAIIGGAVGMSRRLPEIQSRAADRAKQEHATEAISAIEARERVVFQIMQILAAPLIAITAFSAFEPDTVTVAVLIGFTSGFASEAILMKLRQASEAVVGRKVQPVTPAPALPAAARSQEEQDAESASGKT